VTDDDRVRVLVLNGGSSSGKSTLALALQEILDGYWLRLGVDTLIDAAPARLTAVGGGLVLADDGSIEVGPDFRILERQWSAGIAALARAGGRVIIEDNFLSGAAGQRRWRDALGDVPTGWVGVRCPPAVAAEREQARGDRIAGMAAAQAEAVHDGIVYDLEVDTSLEPIDTLAQRVRDHFFAENG
jgi:chloramphenicol 3-O phosphotransferase